MPSYDSTLLRQIWNLVDSKAYFLRDFSDEVIAAWLIKTLKEQNRISFTEEVQLQSYLAQRRCLIRDMVEPRNTGLEASKPAAVPTNVANPRSQPRIKRYAASEQRRTQTA